MEANSDTVFMEFFPMLPQLSQPKRKKKKINPVSSRHYLLQYQQILKKEREFLHENKFAKDMASRASRHKSVSTDPYNAQQDIEERSSGYSFKK